MKNNNEETIRPGETQNVGKVITGSLDEVMHNSMMPYSEYVILDRALPRVEDGLKPVQRRILYSMLELGLEPDKPFRKSARIVGDCLGKYHPHGDTSVYDAMVRLAQPHNMSEILVQGHGNFGSNDGDGAAAMRYTEAKLAPLALELLRDLDKDTVSWTLNFDDTLKEPEMLPGRFPNLLVNGASGIAVGLATNIPPHNLGETISGVVAYIDNPDISLHGLMHYIKAPDFPTGGNIILTELERAYTTGKGKILIRAKYHIEEAKGEKKNIVITEFPYQVNKAKLLQEIASLRDEKKDVLGDISDIRDESDRHGIRAVITIKKDGDAEKIMKTLLKSTDLEYSFAINMVAIADAKPRTMGLKEIISYYVAYQKEVVLRRTKFELQAAKDRLHILEGLLIAIQNIDAVIKIIKTSSSPVEAKMRLKEKFGLSEVQAQAILDMRLARLTNLEVGKIEFEIAELRKKVAYLTSVVNSNAMQLDIVKKELLEIKKKYATPRRSSIIGLDQCLEPEVVDVDEPKEVYVCVNANGELKSIEKSVYDGTNKIFKDGTKTRQVHPIVLETSTNQTILAFTNKGYCARCRVKDIPIVKYKDKGINPREMFADFGLDEKIIALTYCNFDKQEILFFTQSGFVKKSAYKDYEVQKAYFQAVKIKDDDQVVSVCFDEPNTDMIFATKQGQVLYAKKDDVPIQGRISGGVRGINLNAKDQVVYAEVCNDDGELVVVTKNGMAKRVLISQIDKLPRYRKGVRLILLGAGDEVMFVERCTLPIEVVFDFDVTYMKNSEDIPIEPRTTKGKKLKGEKLKGVYLAK
ncbi:MAG: DNA topoisomerase 4 subunit A [Clostridia bacterium]|nr:DNA topoisomerase 4 subunit A [Clostridia bacterium]